MERPGNTSKLGSATNQSRLARNKRRAQEFRRKQQQHVTTRTRYVTYDAVNGRQFNPGVNPPIINYQPWNHVTLAHVIKTNGSLKVSDIPDLLKAQLDPEGRGFNKDKTGDKMFIIQMKIQSIRAWNLTGNLLALTVDEFHDTTGARGAREQLCGIIDTGSPGHIPCAGYQLPLAHKSMVLRNDDQQKDIYICTVQLDPGASGLIYIDILYRFDGPAKPPSLSTYMSRISHLTSAINVQSAEQTERVGFIASTMNTFGEQLKKAIVTKGAEQIALLVSALATDLTLEDAESQVSASSTPSLLEDA